MPAPTPGSTPNFVSPVFDVNTVAPTGSQPAITTVQLFRATSPNGPFTTMVGSVLFTGNPAMMTDTSLAALVSQDYVNKTPIDQYFYYEADQINAAGITSALSPALKVTGRHRHAAHARRPDSRPKRNTGLIGNITNQTKPTFDLQQPGLG